MWFTSFLGSIYLSKVKMIDTIPLDSINSPPIFPFPHTSNHQSEHVISLFDTPIQSS